MNEPGFKPFNEHCYRLGVFCSVEALDYYYLLQQLSILCLS
jgi:hypothetical protein